MARQSFITKLLEGGFACVGDVVRYVNNLGQTLLVGVLTEHGIVIPGQEGNPLNLSRFEQISGMESLSLLM